MLSQGKCQRKDTSCYTKLLKPLGTRRKLNAHKTFKRGPRRLLNVLDTFNSRPVSKSNGHIFLQFFFAFDSKPSKKLTLIYLIFFSAPVTKRLCGLMQKIWLEDDSDGLKLPFWFYKLHNYIIHGYTIFFQPLQGLSHVEFMAVFLSKFPNPLVEFSIQRELFWFTFAMPLQ